MNKQRINEKRESDRAGKLAVQIKVNIHTDRREWKNIAGQIEYFICWAHAVNFCKNLASEFGAEVLGAIPGTGLYINVKP